MRFTLFIFVFLSLKLNADTTDFERVKEKYKSASQSAELTDFSVNTLWNGKCLQAKAPNEKSDASLVVINDGDPVLGSSVYFDVSNSQVEASQLYDLLKGLIPDLKPAYYSKENNSLVQLKKNKNFKELRKSNSEDGAIYFLKVTCSSTVNCEWQPGQPGSEIYSYANGTDFAYCYFYSKVN